MNMSKNKYTRGNIFTYSLIVWCLTFVSPIMAQYRTEVTVTDANSLALENAMNRNATQLLTEFNYAQGEKRSLYLNNIGITPETKETIELLWEICPFRCDELEIVERCLITSSGNQIRNIPIIMEPRTGELFDDDKYQEIVLSFDRQGNISDLFFSLSSNQYKDIMRTGLPVEDLRKRSIVVDFVERFRTAYNRKDLDFLRNIFSNDALIITGKVIKAEKNIDFRSQPEKIQYNVYKKEEYLNSLERVFKNNSYLNIIFEDIKVRSHATKDYLFGVKLVQHWNSSNYSDKGYLFLLWDFGSEDDQRNRPNEYPKIHVRTWQPYDETPKEELFDLVDFNTEHW